MTDANKKIIAFSGTHGTAKSTAASQEYLRLKLSNPNTSVRLLCDLEADCPFRINKETSEQAQIWLYANQLRSELFAMDKFDIVVLDRTLVDIVAYTYVAGFHALAHGMLNLAAEHVHRYTEITLKQARFNAYCHADGIRETQDQDFRQDVEDTLLDLYGKLKADGRITTAFYKQ